MTQIHNDACMYSIALYYILGPDGDNFCLEICVSQMRMETVSQIRMEMVPQMRMEIMTRIPNTYDYGYIMA